MAIRITARHFDIGDVTRNFIEKKIEKLKKFDEHDSDIDVVFNQEKYRYIAEIFIKAGPFKAEAKEDGTDLIAAFEACLKQVERQIKKQKEKIISSKKQGKKKQIEFDSALEKETIKKKQIEIISMVEIEALTKFKNNNLNFLLYENMKTKKINLLLKTPEDKIILYEEK